MGISHQGLKQNTFDLPEIFLPESTSSNQYSSEDLKRLLDFASRTRRETVHLDFH